MLHKTTILLEGIGILSHRLEHDMDDVIELYSFKSLRNEGVDGFVEIRNVIAIIPGVVVRPAHGIEPKGTCSTVCLNASDTFAHEDGGDCRDNVPQKGGLHRHPRLADHKQIPDNKKDHKSSPGKSRTCQIKCLWFAFG